MRKKDAEEELEEVVDDDAESDMDCAPESDHTVVARDRLLRFFDRTGTSASVESAHMVGVRIGYAAVETVASRCRHGAAGSRGGGGSSASESSMIRDTHSSSSASWAYRKENTQ
jgi:hypothetical protein